MIENFAALIIFTLIIVGIYIKIRIPALMVSLYAVFLLIFSSSIQDGDIPLYPWSNIFCIILVTFLLINTGVNLKGDGSE